MRRKQKLVEARLERPNSVGLEPCTTCSAACPVGTDTRAYVDLIAQGRYEEAFEKLREFNPFPSVCGLVCHHPCEEECRRREVDEPVALRNLKRFAVEQSLEYRKRTRTKAAITHSESIGIVGSGPAGLTVAYDCIRQGYQATVYEALPKPGGLLAWAIPRYRLPEDVLADDIDDIVASGVQVKTGVTLGKDVSLDELREKHDVVVLALGLSESHSLPLENVEHPDVHLALPFLRDAISELAEVRDDVIVIGGGNVAVDVARTAVRLGAKTVKMVCLENEEEMPAWEWEEREALEEGIAIIHRRGPKEVIVEDGRITGLLVREVERVFDEQGKFAPTYFDDRLSTVEGEMVIIAIGQHSELRCVEDSDVELSDRGRLVFDPTTMSTSVEGVFACGEVVTGPGSAIEAVASGARTARAVLGYLETGRLAVIVDEQVETVGELPEEVSEKVQRVQRVAMPTLAPEERKKSFVQFELGYDEKAALREARRCLSCTAGAVVDETKCEACLTCLRICPFDVPVVEDAAVISSDICQACGLCAVECPAKAITIKRFADRSIVDRVVKLMEGGTSVVKRVEMVCAQDAETREELRDRVETIDGIVTAKVPVNCAARVEEVDMMKPFELGAESVVLRRCKECRYPGAEMRLARRVGRTREILDAVGVGGERLILE